MRRRSWAVVTVSTALAALVCGYVAVQGSAEPSTGGSATTAASVPVQTGAGASSAATSGTSAPAHAGTSAASTATTATTAPSGASASTSGRHGGIDTGLTKPMHGTAAITALGDALAPVAERAGLSEDELRGVLETDPTAWITQAGRVTYREEIPTAPEQAVGFTADPLTAPYPLADTFALHSLPGSTHTIFLDFDGVTVSARNAWHSELGVPAQTYAGWDPSGNGPSFTNDEKAAIQEIWSRVAEDYAAFDVDVTTADPGEAALSMASASDTHFGTHVVITDSTVPAQVICNNQCGGVAITGAINSPITDWGVTNPPADLNEIAWVFSDGTYNIPSSVAEVSSHESGHTFGLVHDGDNATEDSYYAPADGAGQKVWAPIMGAAYYNTVTQWSKGDYPNAHNWSSNSSGPIQIPLQDDVAIIRSIVGSRETLPSSLASPLTVDPGTTHYITAASQSDTYALSQCAAGATVRANAAQVGADLDISLSVVDANGVAAPGTTLDTNPVTEQDDAGSVEPWNAPGYWMEAPSGLGSAITVPAAGGPYFAVVKGGGNLGGNWLSGGYDNYASLGAYTLEVSGCDTTTALPGAPRLLTAKTTSAGTTLTWAAPLSNGGTALTGYRVQIDGGTEVEVSGRTYVDSTLTSGTHTVSVKAVNAVGVGPAATAQGTLAEVPGPVTGLTATAAAPQHQVTLRWGAPSTGDIVDGYEATVTSGSRVVAHRTFATLPSSYVVTGLAPGRYTATVRATNLGGTSTAAVTVSLPAYVAPTVPGRPSAVLKAGKKGGKKTVVMTWGVPASAVSPRPTAYRLTIYRVVKGKAKVVKTITATSTAVKRELALAAKKGVTYAFTVQVRNSVGWSPVSKRSKAVAPK
ncbi:M12 family metallo-peptidase [Nocardioides sp.]|uniref:fibronectin type III domain-containing protein n=1 Tax=Nocardioides sp. TaxID=35761 RepID=UPI00261703AA|nr:M12 family metallo-peptidase [Nocardioides sp.]